MIRKQTERPSKQDWKLRSLILQLMRLEKKESLQSLLQARLVDATTMERNENYCQNVLFLCCCVQNLTRQSIWNTLRSNLYRKQMGMSQCSHGYADALSLKEFSYSKNIFRSHSSIRDPDTFLSFVETKVEENEQVPKFSWDCIQIRFLKGFSCFLLSPFRPFCIETFGIKIPFFNGKS